MPGKTLDSMLGNMSRDGGGRNYLSSSSKTRVGGEEGTEVCARVIMVMVMVMG